METPKRFFNPFASGKDRNKPCICGSGKKLKKCHGDKAIISETEFKELTELWNNQQKELETELMKHE